jgi:hypothetical protein
MLDPFGVAGRASASSSVSDKPPGEPAGRRRMPLNGETIRSSGGWTVRIPLTVEEVLLTKEIIISEEIHVATRPVSEVAHVTGSVRREQLHIETVGDLEETRPVRVHEIAETERGASPAAPDQSIR